jgi:uncharacterized protein (TIGR00251 family)
MVLRVRVKPNARTSSFAHQPDGTWLAMLKSAPVDGKANRELVQLVARHFGCTKASVTIKSGTTGRIKLIEVVSGNTKEDE